MSGEETKQLDPEDTLKLHTKGMMDEPTSFEFDPIRLSRLVKTRRAQSVELELERYRHWGVIRLSGDDLAPMSLKLDESTCAASLTNNRDQEDLRAALGTLRRVNGRVRHGCGQIKQSEDIESCIVTSTPTRVLRPSKTTITPVVSLRKTSDRRTLEAVAQIAQKLPLDMTFSQQAPVHAYHHLQRSKSSWDASCLLYYGSLIEGTLLAPNVDAVTAASSISTDEHTQCRKDSPSKTRDVPFSLLFVLILVSSLYVISTNVFIEPTRQSLKQHSTVISLHRTIRTMRRRISSAWARQSLYSDEMNSWLGDTLHPLIQVKHNFQPTALLDEVGAPDDVALLNLGSCCEERLHGERQGLEGADITRRTETRDRSSSLRWKPDNVPDAASKSVLENSSIFAVLEDPMLPTLKLATHHEANEECSLVAIFYLEKCFLFEFHEMCPIATQLAERADEMSRVTPLPVVESTMTRLVRGLQRSKLKEFVGDVWMYRRQRVKVWTPFKDERWKARAGELLRKWDTLFRSILFLPERIRSALLCLNHDFRNHVHGDIMGALQKFILKLPVRIENGFRSK